jgi:hypothetical protein
LNLERCLDLRIEPSHSRRFARPESKLACRPRARAVRKAIVQVLEHEAGELRLMTLHQRVERLLGASVPIARFRDYVNEQSRGKKPILERLGYGRYGLR